MEWWKFLILIVGSYLIGNIFFARIISRARHYDISKSGSGNPGTMNMLRNLGLVAGLMTLVCDMLKGVVPALVGYYLFGGEAAGINAYIGMFTGGLSALIGNIFPVFYNFKGGKGAAVVYGIYFAVQPIMGLIIFVCGIIYLLIFDYASLLSFLMITAFTIYEGYSLGIKTGGNIVISCLLFAIFLLVFYAHRKNIFRLLVGKENGVNFRGKIAELKNKKMNKAKKEEEKLKEIG